MEMSLLRAYVAAVEEKTLSRAALREDLVISAVSKRITELERQVGVSLLLRHGRGVAPTAAGATFYQRAKAILRSLSLAQDELCSYSADGTPKVRLAANPSTTVQFFPRDISQFLRANAGFRLNLVEASSVDVPRMIVDGEADIGIYHAAAPTPGLHSRPYRKDKVCLVVPAGHPLAGRKAIRMEDALDYEFLGYFPRHSLEGFLELAGPSISRPPLVRSEVSNYEARCRMVAEGLGIAIIPAIIARNYLAMMQFSIVDLLDDWALRQMHICVRDRHSLPAMVEQLFSHLLACATDA
ncbi:LysR family transcriptional regulator [Bordetella sp. BOR01]|nr:LysR family transcriptional regulator [Bordetella sp. BOR01]